MRINLKYLYAFLILLVIEIMIALFIRDTIIRPYIGDVLVIILMYTFIRAISKPCIKYLPIYLFVFASFVELAQYFNIVNVLHLQDCRVISVIIGNTFDIKDILCYLIGTLVLIVWENRRGLI